MEKNSHIEVHEETPFVSHTPPSQRSRRFLRFIGALAAILAMSALVPTSLAIGYDRYYAGKIFPSTSVFGISMTGMTKDEAKSALRRKTNEILGSGVTFLLDGDRFTITKTEIDAGQLIRFDTDRAVQDAYDAGRLGSISRQLADRYTMALAGRRVKLATDIDEQALSELLAKHYAGKVKSAVDAAPLVKVNALGEVESVSILPASNGTEPRFTDAVRKMRERLLDQENPTITVQIDILEPKIRATDAEPHLAEITNILGPREIRLIHETQGWSLTRRDIAKAVAFVETKDGLQVGIDVNKLSGALKPVRKALEIPAKNAIFTMKESKVVEFIPHEQGRGIDEVALALNLRDALYQSKAGIEVPLKPTDPEVTTDKSNSLGIKEALGIGHSSFKRSPKNRIENITNGVTLLNMTLIPPDTEFSLVNTLKPFDDTNGYKPELVIKGKKIEPEFGGGLCQIGTTTFRATMNSGLPVTMRANHTLVVSYYNDPGNGNPGSDATIYDPLPDYRFLNDTGHYILIEAKILPKQELEFTFWGTSDGRKGSYEPPEVSKWTPVPKDAKKVYLESDTVKTGEQKCEPGFPGAIATLKYTVEKPNKQPLVKTFTSIYKMLPPTCLVAKGEIPKEDATNGAGFPASGIPIPATDAGEPTR